MPENAATQTVTMKVLRQASDVLGTSKPLQVAKPFQSSNAPGPLREVESMSQIKSAAGDSARRFLAANFADESDH